MTGTFTLHHAIDASSPLFDILQKGHDAMLDAAFALNVTFQGLDSVYHDDVVAIHRYRFSNDLLFDHTFAWLSRRDARTGKMAIDFDRLNEVVPAAPAAARPVLDASSAGRLARLRSRLDVARPHFARSTVHVFVGALRAHDANPDAHLERSCCFSQFCEAALRERGVPFDAHLVDLDHKPRWFVDLAAAHDAPAQTPMALFVDDAGAATLVKASNDVLLELPKRCAGFEGFAPDEGRFSTSDAEVTALMGAWFVLMKATPLTARAALADREARAPLVEAFVDKIRPIEHALAFDTETPFLSGRAEPGREDLKWAVLVRAFWDLTDVFQPDAVDAARRACPLVVSWAATVCARPAVRAAAAESASAFFRYVEHIADHYFPFLKPAVPGHMRDALDALAPDRSPAERLASLHRSLDRCGNRVCRDERPRTSSSERGLRGSPRSPRVSGTRSLSLAKDPFALGVTVSGEQRGFHTGLDAAEPRFFPGTLHLFVGALRVHGANPDASLDRCCMFSQRVRRRRSLFFFFAVITFCLNIIGSARRPRTSSAWRARATSSTSRRSPRGSSP